ncbi:MAG TPA: IclR family transcriptional regulator [Acidimicrobiia bacterium]|nr:IclR family transcriptional regulator [Acidimicrobiia bacterium]
MPTVQSIERAFGILHALAVRPAGVSEVANAVDLPKSTVARLLATLEAVGAVERTDDGGYRVGSGLRELAGSVDSTVAMATAVRPHLDHLSSILGEATGLTMPDGFSAVFVAQVESPNPVQVRDYTGLSLPMHVGPGSLVILSEWPAEQVARYLSRPLQSFTPFTVTDPELILKRLASIRADGHCWIHEEFAEGINSVAAPVRDGDGRIIAAISAHGPSYRFPEVGEADRIAERVKAAARRFSLQLDTI